MHLVGFYYNNISRCTVLWLSKKVEEHVTARQAIDGSKTRHVCYACCITEATDGQSTYYILLSTRMVTRTYLNITFISTLPLFLHLVTGVASRVARHEYCLSTTRMVTRTHLNITFISTLPLLLHLVTGVASRVASHHAPSPRHQSFGIISYSDVLLEVVYVPMTLS